MNVLAPVACTVKLAVMPVCFILLHSHTCTAFQMSSPKGCVCGRRGHARLETSGAKECDTSARNILLHHPTSALEGTGAIQVPHAGSTESTPSGGPPSGQYLLRRLSCCVQADSCGGDIGRASEGYASGGTRPREQACAVLRRCGRGIPPFAEDAAKVAKRLVGPACTVRARPRWAQTPPRSTHMLCTQRPTGPGDSLGHGNGAPMPTRRTSRTTRRKRRGSSSTPVCSTWYRGHLHQRKASSSRMSPDTPARRTSRSGVT